MKTIILFAALVATAASAAISPALHADGIVKRHATLPDAHEPTVDATSTRGQWVTSYSNNQAEAEHIPTVDETSTRGQWVTSYSNKAGKEPTVDETSTRGRWVTSYPKSKTPVVELQIVDHWLPTGPAYLDMNALEEGYKAHLMIMHDSSSWIHSGIGMFKRFLGGDAE